MSADTTIRETLETYRREIADANTYRGRLNSEGMVRISVVNECERRLLAAIEHGKVRP